MKRTPNGILPKLKEITGIPVPHLSGYLAGTRAMSKSRSYLLENGIQELGYTFTAADWMYNPGKIKSALKSYNPTPASSSIQGGTAT